MGEYIGDYTRKAMELFNLSSFRFQRSIVKAMGMVKYAAAKVNSQLSLLPSDVAEAIMKASWELVEGKLDRWVVVDVIQTGSGTGLNMNINEVIAKRASELLGRVVHPNDHVNMGQSSNDVVPTAIRVATYLEVESSLIPALTDFTRLLEDKAVEYGDLVKPGRTHLRDALPVTLGQEFKAYAGMFLRDTEFLKSALERIRELPIGGTAVGTGLNTHPRFGELVVEELRRLTGLPFRRGNSFVGMRSLTDVYMVSSAMKAIALDLIRLCNDLRLMYSGPNTGLNEIDIPQEIPGSSIMPGKENPVIVEASMLAAVQVIGLDAAVSLAVNLGEFELSMGIPLTGYDIILEVQLLSGALRQLGKYVIARVKPNKERMRKLAESSTALITLISPLVGYDKASMLSKAMNIRDALRGLGMSEDEINKILNLKRLTEPGIITRELGK
ncbi:MAG: fumarate hydratase [Caldivirga sp.]|jgi:fumarate hydratase class II|nr:fumarate hydratase [Caldivirga sp.]